MRHTFLKTVLLATILPLSLAARATPTATSSTEPSVAERLAAAPTVIAQLEIRGLAPFLSAAERIAAPVLPAGQLTGMLNGMSAAMLGADPFAFLGRTDAPIRAILYTLSKPGILFDMPVADGDTSAFFDRLSAVWTAGEIPEETAARLPSGARLFLLPDGNGGDTSRVLFLPHGDRLAVLPHAFQGGLRPSRVPDFLSSLPSPSVEGQLAVRVNLAPLATALAKHLPDFLDDLHASQLQVDQLLETLSRNPTTACEYGIGLDSADRLRLSYAADLRPGSATARIYTGIGAPASPLPNAILFPDALAAFSEHSSIPTEADLSAWLAEQIDCNPAAATDPRARTLLDKWGSRAVALGAALYRHHDGDLSFALLPPAPGAACPWALCLSSPDAPAFLDALPDLVNDDISFLFELVPGYIELLGDCLPPAAIPPIDSSTINLRLVPAGERTVLGIPVRTFALVLADTGKQSECTLFAFDAAAAGPALLLADLPEENLASVLSDLSSGATGRPALADLPAFAGAYGPASSDAAAGYVKLLPVAQTILRAVFTRIGNLARGEGTVDAAEGIAPDNNFFDDLPPQLRAFLDAENLPDLTLATTELTLPGTTRVVTTGSIPLADLHALVPLLQNVCP